MITARSSVEVKLFDFAAEQRRENQFSSCAVDPKLFGNDPFKYFPETLQWLETYRWMTRQIFKPDHDSPELMDKHFMRRVYKGLVFNWLKDKLPPEQTLLSPHRTDSFTGRVFPRPRSGIEFPDGISIASDNHQGWHLKTIYEYSSISLRKPGYYRGKYRNYLEIKRGLPREIASDTSLMFIIMKREDPEEQLPITEKDVSFSENPFTSIQFQQYVDYLYRDFRFDYGEDEEGPTLEEIAQEAQLQATRIKTTKERREIWKDKLPL